MQTDLLGLSIQTCNYTTTAKSFVEASVWLFNALKYRIKKFNLQDFKRKTKFTLLQLALHRLNEFFEELKFNEF